MQADCKCASCEGVRNSSAFVIAVPDITKIDTALLGLAITLDKPIILVCKPGCKVPEKLAKVVDRFVEIPVKKQLIRTAPSQLEKTARTVRMNRPMRCATCGTTQGFRRIVNFGGERGKRCSKCERNR